MKRELFSAAVRFATFFVAGVLLSLSLKSQPIAEVGGVLTRNTFWSNDTIYVITDLLRVGQGITLEIEKGTEVRVNQGRGINIEGGTFVVRGSLQDTVKFVPNYILDENWNWNGITINSINQPDQIIIQYALIKKATVAIRAIAANFLSIRNNLITDNRNIGISLFNSSFSLIENNRINENFLGIEIFATDAGNRAADNILRGNKLNNHTTNIIIHNSNHGSCPNNVVEENLISDGLHGIWLFNSHQGGSGHAHIRRNIIVNNGVNSEGYGIYVSMDSTIISNNVFYANHIPVYFTDAAYCHFINNNIYQNTKGINIRSNATEIIAFNNTITESLEQVARFQSSGDIVFQKNNIFNNHKEKDIVVNNTTFDIDVTENYWGTTDEERIREMLFDRLDNPLLGSLLFEPLQPFIIDTAPVSPPRNSVLRMIDGKMHLSWNPNPESDIEAYYVYSGDFADYQFNEPPVIVEETNYVFENFNAGDVVAVTAFDRSASGQNPMLDGNESPFAFAVQMPYAGQDSVICQTVLFYTLTDASIPPDSDFLRWKTSGDGFFNNQNLLNPAYFPGPLDIATAEVRLTIIVYLADRILSDSVDIRITPVPEIFAGADAFIEKNETFIASDAFAENFTGLWWSTTGDGMFVNPDNLNAIYQPGDVDLQQEEVFLILQAFSEACGNYSDTLKLTIRNTFSLQGSVKGNGSLLPDHPVIAHYINADSLLLKSYLAKTDLQGYFRFDSLFEGEYLLFSAADTTHISMLLPTYYANAMSWNEAYKITLNGDTYDLDIELQKGESVLPNGQGSISGKFIKPQNEISFSEAYCQSWFNDIQAFSCEDGLPNITVLLFGESGQKILRHTLTDSNGNFHFGNLPFGDYLIRTEIAGFQSDFSSLLSLTAESNEVNNIELRLVTENKIAVFQPSRNPSFTANFRIFPNPVVSDARVRVPQIDEPYIVQVFALDGSIVYSKEQFAKEGEILLSLDQLKNGLYVISIRGLAENRQSKFVKL
jgi:parallel beta-helix repeat protein